MATSTNPIAQQRNWSELSKALKSFTDSISGKGAEGYYSTPAPYDESPQSFRDDYKSNPYQVDFGQLDQTRIRAQEDAQRGNQMANQNAQNSSNRAIYKSQQDAAINTAAYAAQKQIDFNNTVKQQPPQKITTTTAQSTGGWKAITSNGVTSYIPDIDLKRADREHEQNMLRQQTTQQQQLADRQAYNNRLQIQQQNAANLQQQNAQQQAQERLAKIGQQTSIYQSAFGNPGQSNWRWF